jgi:transitional endoplasmic reticulum ATPase
MNAPFKVIKGADVGSCPNSGADPTLTPEQKVALDRVLYLVDKSSVIGLASDPGMGRSLVMRQAALALGASFVGTEDFIDCLRTKEVSQWDVTLFRYLQDCLGETQILLIDGLQDFIDHAISAHGWSFAAQVSLEMLGRQAEQEGKTLVLSGMMPKGDRTVRSVFRRYSVPVVEIPGFSAEDYRLIATQIMGDKASDINFPLVFRSASHLNGHELRVACSVAAKRDTVDTADFLEILSHYVISSNTRVSEVEEVVFDTMPGIEHIAEALETHVVLPLTEPELADQLDLKAKRGVLLYGPPGTGKTSLGRALAHRLKGRFFLIDGSVKTEPAYAFHSALSSIINEAIANAPAVIFIDDADILFGIGHAAGLGRYLLTLLDGLAGESSSQICLMMTAMDASRLPEALLRSGRVELWLETRAPDAETRSEILKRWMGSVLPESDTIDYARLGEATHGFTPADLRRVAADARTYYAADLDAERAPKSGTDYVMCGVERLIATREAMALNLADPSLRIG